MDEKTALKLNEINFQEEVLKKYVRNEWIPVCVLSWEEFFKGQRDTLEVRIGNEWGLFQPACSKTQIYEYEKWTHTYSMTALKKYFEGYSEEQISQLVKDFECKGEKNGRKR
jgi:hypothetical protein